MKLYLIAIIKREDTSPEIWNLVSIEDEHLAKVKETYHVRDFVFEKEITEKAGEEIPEKTDEDIQK